MNYKELVNKDISNNFINNRKLIEVKNNKYEDIKINNKAYSKFLDLQKYLSDMNIYIDIVSAYIEDSEILDCKTGLGIRFILKEENIDELDKIHNTLKDFGFILRYPKGRESITNYLYDPYYIRYVGFTTANIIYNKNLTLEEYHDLYNVNGVLVVNKPSGITSRAVVDEVGKIFDTKKVGHTGTLDPLASGVLILTIGKLTKISSDIMSDDKEYIATVKVGIKTDTLDITGKVLEKKDVTLDINLEEELKKFEKTYLQEVPIYSAVKVNGRKLYQYARSNEKVSLPKKEVTIKEIELLEKKKDTFKFRCLVSKGTYIRSLIRDIGEDINIPLCMSELVRVKEASFRIEDSYTLDEIKNGKYKILSVVDVFDYPVIEIDSLLFSKINNGVKIENTYNIEGKVIFKYKDRVIAIYESVDDNLLKLYKNFI